MITVQFLITSLVVVLIPGLGVVFTVSTGIVRGRRASVFAALGCTAGILPHLLATILGLAAILHTSAVAFQALKFAGVAYKTAFVVEENTVAPTAATGLVVKAFLLNILNPKLTIFFLAFLPQFIEPQSSHPLTQLFILSGIFMAMTFGIFVVYGFLAHAFRRAVIDSPRVQSWLRRSFATAFAGLGANLALSER
jgi:threonine/homoserine/homoserine lactone efflux protein